MSGLGAGTARQHTAQRLAHSRSPPRQMPSFGLIPAVLWAAVLGSSLRGSPSMGRYGVVQFQALILGSPRGSLCPPVASVSIGA